MQAPRGPWGQTLPDALKRQSKARRRALLFRPSTSRKRGHASGRRLPAASATARACGPHVLPGRSSVQCLHTRAPSENYTLWLPVQLGGLLGSTVSATATLLAQPPGHSPSHSHVWTVKQGRGLQAGFLPPVLGAGLGGWGLPFSLSAEAASKGQKQREGPSHEPVAPGELARRAAETPGQRGTGWEHLSAQQRGKSHRGTLRVLKCEEGPFQAKGSGRWGRGLGACEQEEEV